MMALESISGVRGEPASFSGHIFGEVRALAGVVQMGATVALYNRYDQEIRRY